MATARSPKQPRLLGLLSSPIGKKLLTGLTGLGLVLFVILHLLGNLSYFGDPGAFNLYADFLLSLGKLLWVAELLLLVAFLLHAYLGINIYLGKKRARKENYKAYRSAGKPSLQTISSRSMIFTGLVLLVFIVIHLFTFKFGPGIEEGYIADAQGLSIEQTQDALQENSVGPDAAVQVGNQVYVRDLRRLMTETFQSPLYAFGYFFVMLLLGFHLRHGVWSAFQSLGATNPKLTPVIYTLGGILAFLLAVGFLVIPLYIFFFVDPPTAAAALGAAP